jgi:hypothetical protein
MEVVEVLSKLDMENQTELTEVKAKLIEEGAFKCVRSSQDEWKLQGIKFYRKKCFDQATKCFTFAGEEQLANRCLAFIEADKGQQASSEMEAY